MDPNVYPGGPTVRGMLSDGTFSYHTSIQEAYNEQGDGYTIRVAGPHYETLYLDRPIDVLLIGDFIGGCLSDSGSAIIRGNMNVSNGTVYIENFILE